MVSGIWEQLPQYCTPSTVPCYTQLLTNTDDIYRNFLLYTTG